MGTELQAESKMLLHSQLHTASALVVLVHNTDLSAFPAVDLHPGVTHSCSSALYLVSTGFPLEPLLLVHWAFNRFQVFAQLLLKVPLPLLDKLTKSQAMWFALKSSKNVNCYIMFLA